MTEIPKGPLPDSMNRLQPVALRFLSCLLLMVGAHAGAASLQISPVMISLRAGQGATGITMQNMGEAPVYGQVRVYLWEQKNGDDVLTPTQEIVASPPIIQIAPKTSQIIRLVRRSQQLPPAEQSYRILIDEIPHDDGAPSSGVDIRLRYSVPMFVLPAAEHGAPALAWSVFRKDGNWMLRVRNSGTQRAQIGALNLGKPDGQRFEIAQGLFGYVLAGQWREWRLPTPKEADLDGTLSVKANINMQPQTATTVDNIEEQGEQRVIRPPRTKQARHAGCWAYMETSLLPGPAGLPAVTHRLGAGACRGPAAADSGGAAT